MEKPIMRLILASWWGLIIFWILTTDLGAQSRPARQLFTPKTSTWPEEVVAFGTSPDKARNNAGKQVQKMLRDYVPLKSWTPTEDYIRKNLVAGPGREKKSEEMNPEEMSFKKDLEKLEQTVYAWILPLKTPEFDNLRRLDRRHQEQQDRAARSESRLILLGKIHLGLILLLALVPAYVRLDQWTKGNYSRWLRLAGLSLLAAVGAGLWMLP